MQRRRLTSINGRDYTLNDHDGQRVKASQSLNDLSDSRQLTNHVQEQGNERHEAQIQHGDDAVSLTSPLREDETLGASSPDDRTKISKDEHGQRRRKSVDHHALHTRNGRQLGIREKNAGTKSYKSQFVNSNVGRGRRGWNWSGNTFPTQALT